MAVEWRRVGGAVVVTLSRDHDALWRALRERMYGVASPEGDALTRTRVLSLAEAYYALADEQLLSTSPASSLDAVWRDFASASRSFVAQYVVFRHFRQLGWRLRSGLNYGAVFVLYRGDADTFHSEYIVYVVDERDDATPWHAVQARTRVAEDVKKTVVLCEVSVFDGDDVDVLAEAAQETGEIPSDDSSPRMETHARHALHGVGYALDAVLIRYWDPATVDEDRVSYAFAPQPVLLKKPTDKKKSKTKKNRGDKRPRATAIAADDA